MIDGIGYLLAFSIGALVTFAVTNYYHRQIVELMRDMIRMGRKKTPPDDDITAAK